MLNNTRVLHTNHQLKFAPPKKGFLFPALPHPHLFLLWMISCNNLSFSWLIVQLLYILIFPPFYTFLGLYLFPSGPLRQSPSQSRSILQWINISNLSTLSWMGSVKNLQSYSRTKKGVGWGRHSTAPGEIPKPILRGGPKILLVFT